MAYLRAPVFLAISALFALAVSACGGSSTPEEGWGNGEPGSDPATGSAAGNSGDEADPGVVRSGQADAGPDPAPTDSGTTATNTTSDASTHPTIPCTSPNACSSARDVGEIVGDGAFGISVVRGQGTTSEWLKVRVRESSSAVSAAGMGVTATLVSPSATDFDVSLYVDTDNDVQSCSSPKMTGDKVSATWGESGRFANNSDDSRWVTFKVTQKSGTCAPDASWLLLIEGGIAP